MNTRCRSALVLASIVAACGCGGSSSTPTAPTTIVVAAAPPTPAVPSISGQWTGTYTVGSCSESGSAFGSGFCSSLGRGGGLVFTPSQSGGTVTGTLGVGGFNIPVSGSLGTDNVLVLAGGGTVTTYTTLTLNAWRSTLAGATMSGAFTYTIVSSQFGLGSVVVTAGSALAK